MELSKLKEVIPTYKWRVQSVSKNFPVATCVAYIDAREVMDILDETVGPENWQSDYREIKGNLYAGVAIKINGEWIWKWDCGTKSSTEPEKGEASDAFKRAAVKWSIGRFLYELPVKFVKTNEKKTFDNYPFPVDENGAKIKDLTEYINNQIEKETSTSKSKNKYKKKENSPAPVETPKNIPAPEQVIEPEPVIESEKVTDIKKKSKVQILREEYLAAIDNPEVDSMAKLNLASGNYFKALKEKGFKDSLLIELEARFDPEYKEIAERFMPAESKSV